MPACEELLKQLAGDDVEAIRDAAYTAADEQCEEAVELLAEQLKSRNLGVQEAADMALRRLGGSRTVQAILPLLRSDEAPVRNLSMDILREVGSQDFNALVALLHDDDADIRIFSSDILGATGNVLAVPALCEALLKDPEVNVRYQAAVSLGNMASKEAAACLNKAMNDEEWVQFAVIEALTKIRDESSVGALVKALDSSTDLVASMIVDALGVMGNIKAVGLLLNRLDSSSPPLRNKIVKAIIQILGGKSLSLLSQKQREMLREYLLAALHDDDEEIQDAAIQGLGVVGGEKAAAEIFSIVEDLDPVADQDRLEHIYEALSSIGFNVSMQTIIRSGTWKQGMAALRSIERMQPDGATDLLMEVFWDKDKEMQQELSKALAVAAGEEARGFFMDILTRHEDGDVLKEAMAFLSEKLHAEDAGERMFELLDHPFDDVKETALNACIALGGPEMNERFKRLIGSDDPLNRMMAAYALGQLGVHENMSELKLALEDEVPDIRKVALEAVGDICCMLEPDLSLVLSRLNDENREVRLAVVKILGRCADDIDVLEHLFQALEDEDDWVRIRAVEALGERKRKEALPRLVPLLESENKLLAMKVTEALGAVGGETAFRALLDVASGDDPELQEAAEEALARMKDEQTHRSESQEGE